jgi:hypothetical protein
LNSRTLSNKQILITGATNGIGLAAAEALAALGANLAIVGRSQTRTRIASARIRAAAGRGATVATFIADLSSRDGELLPPWARGNRIQPQQRPADELGDDDPEAGGTQPGEGRRNPCVACHLARRCECERGILL